MISAVDTNVLLDVFRNDPVHCEASARVLRECIGKGTLVASDIVWAELAASFPDDSSMQDAVERLGIEFSPLEDASAMRAGRLWQQHRKRGGARRRVLADFLIGAHAMAQADQLVTRDRGFFRDYFARLRIVDPTRG